MAERHSDERSIFLSAIEIDSADQRNAYLDTACGNDPNLRGAVEALLREHETAQVFMDSPGILSPTIDQPTSEQIGTHIGPYHLREELGEGGMGAVFMATQKEPIRRKVALKVIKAGMDSKQVVSRFEAERQALAMMDHPNIAKVHDGGTTASGRPYFVMELVEGIPITAYCDRHRLSTNDRLELFGDVCRAVQHAHQKGIIHRDLKPSNILVTLLDDKATPKVIDFGVAKATSGHLMDGSQVTAYSQLVGTPLYMSPEQAEASAVDVDTRSDVYSLGVLLYELLTGVPPFDRERMRSVSFDEFRRIVREEDPPRPSTRLSTLDAALDTVAEKHHTDPRTLTHEVSDELDWIVMKSLEKDRTRRYGSANELAKDVQRYLDDEAVEACPPSRSYRLRKFTRRNKTVIISAALVFSALLAGVVGTTWQALQATDERNRAEITAAEKEAQRKEAERQQQIAQENFERARDAVDEYLTRVSQEQLLNAPGLQPLRKDLLELALKYYQAFIAERGNDPELLADLAKAYMRVARITNQIGSPDETLKAVQTALNIRRKLVAENPDVLDYQAALVASYDNLGNLQSEIGKTDEALASHRKAFEIGEKLAARNPDVPKYQGCLAALYHSLGVQQHRTGKLEALASYQKAIEIREKLMAENPDIFDYHETLANNYSNLGILQRATGKPDEALASYQRALEIREKLVAKDPDSLNFQAGLAGSYRSLASLQKTTGKPDAALASYQKAIAIREKLAAQNPVVLAYQASLADTYGSLGRLRRNTGKPDMALDVYGKAIGIYEKLLAQHPAVLEYQAKLALTCGSLANLQKNIGKPEAALTAFQQAIDIYEKLAAEHPEVLQYQDNLASNYNNLGMLQRDSGKRDEALAFLKKAIDIREKLVAENPHISDSQGNLAMHYANRGVLLDDTGKLDEALASYQKANDIWERLASENPAVLNYQSCLATIYNNVGLLQHNTGKRDEALASYQRALDTSAKLASENPTVLEYQSDVARAHNSLGRLQRDTGKHEEAVASFERVVEIVTALAEPSRTPALWDLLGQALYRLGRWQESREALEAGIRLREETELTMTSHSRWWYLTMALAQLEKKGKARSYYEQLAADLAEQEHPSDRHEKLRKEAAELLGITETPADEAGAEEAIDETTPDESGTTGREGASVPQGKDGRPSASAGT